MEVRESAGYPLFTAKSEINEAVCMGLLSKIEAEAEKIAASRGTAAQKIRNLFGSVEKTHHNRCISSITVLNDNVVTGLTPGTLIKRR